MDYFPLNIVAVSLFNLISPYSIRLCFLCKELLILAYQLHGLPQFVDQAFLLNLLFFHLLVYGGQKRAKHVALVHVGSLAVHQTNHYKGRESKSPGKTKKIGSSQRQ